MTRDFLVRVVKATLEMRGVPGADQHAEAVASQLDMFAAVMGGGAAPAPPEAPRPAAPPFPSPHPQSAIVQPEASQIREPEPEPIADIIGANPPLSPEPSLITTDTRMPSREEIMRSRRPQGPDMLQPQQRAVQMTVPELNQLIQDRTPVSVPLDIPIADGVTRRVIFQRDVISMHGFDAVKIVLYPPGVPANAREAAEAQAVVSLNDIPLNLTAVMEKLKKQAIESLIPRAIPESVMPRTPSGPVMAVGTYEMDNSTTATNMTQGDLNANQALFAASAGIGPTA